jgi:electron transport complex protein RnfE
LVFGLVIAVLNYVSSGRAVKKKDFSCEGCPSKGSCGGTCDKESLEVEKNGNV